MPMKGCNTKGTMNRRTMKRRPMKRCTMKRRPMKRCTMKGGKWSIKYKKSINCNHPKGFSQKQHCKYGKRY